MALRRFKASVNQTRSKHEEPEYPITKTKLCTCSRYLTSGVRYLHAVHEVLHQGHEKRFYPLHLPGQHRDQFLDGREREGKPAVLLLLSSQLPTFWPTTSIPSIRLTDLAG